MTCDWDKGFVIWKTITEAYVRNVEVNMNKIYFVGFSNYIEQTQNLSGNY